METAIVADITGMTADEFDALDTAGGAAACYQRVRQREADRRWHVRYLQATRDGRLVATVPVYVYRGKSWPDTAYDVGAWGLPDQVRSGCDPGSCLLVGGCTDGHSSLHVKHANMGAGGLRRVVAGLASLAASQDRCLVFPYMNAKAKTALDEVTGGSIEWTILQREAHLRGVSDPEWERSLGSRAYGVLRRDRRLIASARLRTSLHSWPEVEDEAIELIASHNARKGGGDHPEFVRSRYVEWTQCGGVDVVVFKSTADSLAGVLTALVWRDELELREIGLSGCEGPRRLGAYLDLLFHQPLAFARARGLRNIRAGFAAEVPKRSRGAVFEELYGGVLTRAQTIRLARYEYLPAAAGGTFGKRRIAVASRSRQVG